MNFCNFHSTLVNKPNLTSVEPNFWPRLCFSETQREKVQPAHHITVTLGHYKSTLLVSNKGGTNKNIPKLSVKKI